MVRNSIIPPSTAYLVFPWVKDMTTIVTSDEGESLVALAGNAVPIRRTEELVARGKQRYVVGVVGNISKCVGHGDGDPYWMSRPLSITSSPLPLSQTHSNPIGLDLVSIHLIHVFSFLLL